MMGNILENEFKCNDCDYVLEKWEMKHECPACGSEDITIIDDDEES